MGSRVSPLGFKPSLCLVLALWPWPNDWISLGLNFLICEMRDKSHNYLRNVVRIK